ncbi:ferrochelatase, partial [Acinetobacter baumannii]|nr:ferrochelatase [Acinetobacter baumannii]
LMVPVSFVSDHIETLYEVDQLFRDDARAAGILDYRRSAALNAHPLYIEALADLVMSPELRSGLYAFDLVQKRARKPAGAPDPSLARKVGKVGVVGAGLMATQLAVLFLRRLHVPVVISDVDHARVERGVAGIHGEVDR